VTRCPTCTPRCASPAWFLHCMHFPTRWDPYFRDLMTVADVYRYPGQHYDHHRRQLTLSRMTKPPVLFLCTHNAGRSQMALGVFNAVANGRAVGYSGGSEPRSSRSRRFQNSS
jgi:hypothetical protein